MYMYQLDNNVWSTYMYIKFCTCILELVICPVCVLSDWFNIAPVELQFLSACTCTCHIHVHENSYLEHTTSS